MKRIKTELLQDYYSTIPSDIKSHYKKTDIVDLIRIMQEQMQRQEERPRQKEERHQQTARYDVTATR